MSVKTEVGVSDRIEPIDNRQVTSVTVHGLVFHEVHGLVFHEQPLDVDLTVVMTSPWVLIVRRLSISCARYWNEVCELVGPRGGDLDPRAVRTRRRRSHPTAPPPAAQSA